VYNRKDIRQQQYQYIAVHSAVAQPRLHTALAISISVQLRITEQI